MRVHSTQDRVTMNTEEVRRVLKDYIEACTNRRIDGEIYLSTSATEHGQEIELSAHLLNVPDEAES